MGLVKTVTLQITGEIRDAAAKVGLIGKDWQSLAGKSPLELKVDARTEEAKRKLAEIGANAERLKAAFPEFAVKLDTGAATAKLALLRHELRGSAKEAGTSGGKFALLGQAFSGVAASALGTLPVLGSTGGLIGVVGAAAAAAAIALTPLVAGLAVAAVGFAGFAAVAVPVIGKVIKARTALGAAEAKYDAATTKAQRAAALKAEAAATAGLTGAQKALLGPMGQIAHQFGKLTAAVQPQVTIAFAEGLRIVKDLMPALTPLVKAAGKAVDALLKSMAGWLESPSGKKFLHWLETQGPKDIKAFGADLWTIVQVFGKVVHFMLDEGETMDRRLKTNWHSIAVGVDVIRETWVRVGHDLEDIWNRVVSGAHLLKDEVHLIWDRMAIDALGLVLKITVAFGHLPGRMGQPFRDASAVIRTELGHMADDVRNTVGKINADLAGLHGRKVALIFSLDLPPGVSFPSRHIKGRAAGGTVTPGELAWVGERGAELVHFRGPATVFSNAQSKKIAGYASGTLDSFSWSLPSTRGLAAAFQAAIGEIAREIRGLIGVLHVTRPGGGLGKGSLGIAERAWTGAGGPGGLAAHIAGAITGAESGFNPRAVQQGQPYATTGWGAWQITPGNSEPQAGINGQLLNWHSNAIAAVAKYWQAGGGFTPWTTFTSGAYRQFMDRGGWLKPGWNGPMYNGTGKMEHLVPAGRAGDESRGIEKRLDRLISLMEAAPAATGSYAAAGTVRALNGLVPRIPAPRARGR